MQLKVLLTMRSSNLQPLHVSGDAQLRNRHLPWRVEQLPGRNCCWHVPGWKDGKTEGRCITPKGLAGTVLSDVGPCRIIQHMQRGGA